MDLRWWVSDLVSAGQYVELARLRGNKGNQVYDIPADVNLSQYRSVSIWCKRFAVSFGAAEFR